ncbi:MAG: ATP-binding cassette domain-containing protein, partial [Micrococcaceae bacterium]|nr:ATP-binding cassette domain-containing protein [Micrococcaceae bacterium]
MTLTTEQPTATSTTNTGSLSLVDVTLEYPDGEGTVKALDGVDLTVRPGQMVSLVGPSGSGKSSLLATAATLVRPTAGRVFVDGAAAPGLSDQALPTL